MFFHFWYSCDPWLQTKSHVSSWTELKMQNKWHDFTKDGPLLNYDFLIWWPLYANLFVTLVGQCNPQMRCYHSVAQTNKKQKNPACLTAIQTTANKDNRWTQRIGSNPQMIHIPLKKIRQKILVFLLTNISGLESKPIQASRSFSLIPGSGLQIEVVLCSAKQNLGFLGYGICKCLKYSVTKT